jgi:dienelactone hydrolase
MYRYRGLLFVGLAFLSFQACAQVVAPANALPAKIAVEDFAKLPFITGPELSPNGKFIAATLSVEGRSVFGVISIFDKASKPTLIGLPEGVSLQSYRWVNDDWLVVTIRGEDLIDTTRASVVRHISVSRDGRNIFRLNKASGGQIDDLVHIPDDGRTEVLLGISDTIYSNVEGFWPSVKSIDVTTGKTKSVVVKGRDPIRDWYADSSGVVRLGIGYSYESNRGKLIYRGDVKSQFQTMDRADYNDDEDLMSPALFTRDPNKIIIYDNIKGKSGVYEYDVAQKRTTQTIFESEKYPLNQIVSSADGWSVAGIQYTSDRPRVEWLDPALKQMQSEIEAAVKGRFVQFVSWDKLRQNFIVKVSDTKEPGQYYYYSVETGVMNRLASVREKLTGKQHAEMKEVKYKARDGLEIHAYLTLPVGRSGKNLPLVVYPHGGPWARDYLTFDDTVQFLANRGYAVLQPNFRGSTGYGEKFTDMGEGQWGLSMQDDVTDGVKWLVSQGIVDQKRVCIMGGSYGGYAALTGTVRDPDLYRCAISFAGISDLPGLLRYDRNFLYFKGQKKAVVGDGANLVAVSAINSISKIKTPILLIHGKKDLRVPYYQSSSMASALQKAGKPVELVLQPEGDHHLSREEDRLSYFRSIDAFLTKHNPAD